MSSIHKELATFLFGVFVYIVSDLNIKLNKYVQIVIVYTIEMISLIGFGEHVLLAKNSSVK